MATITPVRSSPAWNIEKLFWETLTSADTATALQIHGIVSGSMQVTGTFGGGVAVLQGTNDGTNYADLLDVNGNAVSFSVAGIVDFRTSALSIRPATSGGTADDVDVTIILRQTLSN